MIYLIEGKPHRECECDAMSNVCQRGPAVRKLQTCGFSRCFVPAPDVLIAGTLETMPAEATPEMIAAVSTILQPYAAKLVWKRMALVARSQLELVKK